MAKKRVTSRAALVQGLQEDLQREYQAIIQYVIYSQVLDGAENMAIAKELEKHAHQELDHALRIARQIDYFGAYPAHQPKTVKTPKDTKGMLRADLQAEDDTIASYRTRIRQAQELGEYALAEELEQIVKQEQDHQIELATALGVTADPTKRRA
jgi:bacterioferritin